MRSRVDERLERSERVVGKRKREEKDVKRPREKQNYSTETDTSSERGARDPRRQCENDNGCRLVRWRVGMGIINRRSIIDH